LDGSGKTTQAGLLAGLLTEAGLNPLRLKEPSDGPRGREIRRLFQNGRPRSLTPGQELALFTADRQDDADQNILPALRTGRPVIIDRYIVSSLAYQGALGLPLEEILEAGRHFPWPDLTIILDLDPQEGLRRIEKSRGRLHPAFEKLDYLRKAETILRNLDSLGLPGIRHLPAGTDPQALAGTILRLAGTLGLDLPQEPVLHAAGASD
jgi:dTMP kinase